MNTNEEPILDLLRHIIGHIPEPLIDPALSSELTHASAGLIETAELGSGVIRHLAACHGMNLDRDHTLSEPVLLMSMSALCVLLLYYSGQVSSDVLRLRQSLENTVRLLIRRFLEVAQEQVDALRAVLNGIINYFQGLQILPKRIVILEFPVGNSIPSKLLHSRLNQLGIDAELIRVSLSRNDSVTYGLTRASLLESKFGQHPIGDGDVVVWIDEWLTGSNFNNLLRVLRRLTKQAGASFIPVALLAPGVVTKESYAKDHDKALREVRLRGEDFRYEFPRLKQRMTSDMVFFWSEYDRLAGYRKMQILGAIASSLFAAIEEMEADDSKLRISYDFMLNQVRDQLGPETMDECALKIPFTAYRRRFHESLAEFKKCRNKIEAIEDSSNTEEVQDPAEAITRINAKIKEVVQNGNATHCVYMATGYMVTKASRDPSDRFYFRGHVPAVSELDGDLAMIHCIAMEELLARCGS